MGFFSFKTSDSKKSIPNVCSNKGTFEVHLITEDGQVFTEKEYEGYGVFGGRDIYTLIGEMNGVKGKTREEIRNKVFNGKITERGVTNGKIKLAYQKDFENYESPIKAQGGKTANQLSKEGWESYGGSDLTDIASRGFKVPKLVETLPDKKDWKKIWDTLPYPADCKDQGFFYDDIEDEVA
jgi:hypothetical protein